MEKTENQTCSNWVVAFYHLMVTVLTSMQWITLHFCSAIIMGDPQTLLKGIAKRQWKPLKNPQKATATK